MRKFHWIVMTVYNHKINGLWMLSGEQKRDFFDLAYPYLEEEVEKSTWTKASEDIDRILEWLNNPKRQKAQTYFTAGTLRAVAKEIEFHIHKATK